MALTLCISATEEGASDLVEKGPRRDFLELAARSGGKIVYREEGRRRRGLSARLLGPHVWQAWAVAREARGGDVVFADGEHVGLPLVLFLALLRRRGCRVVMLGHLLTRWWKLVLVGVCTRTGVTGCIVVHSAEQRRRVRRWVAGHWTMELVAYQVDTRFWADEPFEADGETPLVLAVGSENRDYDTLVAGVDGLPLRMVIAAGSHWARRTAAVAGREGIEYIDRPLPFETLREMYRQAAVVVVPLKDVPNQSGVTTILEAMSTGRAVIVTATRGQRECIVGPLCREDGTLDWQATAARGPGAFGLLAPRAEGAASGIYVPVDSPAALRAALKLLLSDAGLRRSMGSVGRESAERSFSIERYVSALEAVIDSVAGSRLAVIEPKASRT